MQSSAYFGPDPLQSPTATGEECGSQDTFPTLSSNQAQLVQDLHSAIKSHPAKRPGVHAVSHDSHLQSPFSTAKEALQMEGDSSPTTNVLQSEIPRVSSVWLQKEVHPPRNQSVKNNLRRSHRHHQPIG